MNILSLKYQKMTAQVSVLIMSYQKYTTRGHSFESSHRVENVREYCRMKIIQQMTQWLAMKIELSSTKKIILNSQKYMFY